MIQTHTSPNTTHSCEDKVFQKLFQQIAPSLRNYLYYKSGNLENSEDLIQTAFVKLWENCRKVAPQSAKAFLYKVANHLFINQAIREQKKIKLVSKLQTADTCQETPQFHVEYDEYKLRLETALDKLPSGQREVFLMNRIDKMSYREIAENLNISIKAVEKRMHKALLKLKHTLSN